MARVTLQTIADQVGVSRMTVSNAFSRPDQLSAELRERILSVAHELGYVGPDPTARALARGTTGAVGVLLTDSLQDAFTNEVATAFLSSIVEGLAPTGLALTLLTSDGRDDVVPARDIAIDGAVVYSCHVESAARDWLLRRKVPLVYVDQDPVPGISSVNVDDRGGARAAAQHVVDLGHRRVAILNTVVDGTRGIVEDPLAEARGHPPRQRMFGWLDALEAAGIRPTVAQTRNDGAEHTREAARSLLTHEPRPTAVLCFSDLLALEVIRVARQLGMAVPEDLSVVGFDDSPAAQHGQPALTTVRQDVAAKGRLASDALAVAIESAKSGVRARVRHRVLPTELVVRESTALATGRS
jgi:DNA-binding LacI/PurR family transcriptional regulator